MNPPDDFYDRSEPCHSCGADIHFVNGVAAFPKCPLCGASPERPVVAVLRAPERRTCPDCKATASGQDWLPHRIDCPRIARTLEKWDRERAEREEAKKRHPSSRVRIPLRTLGERVWSDEEERYTSRGEELS
jgi:predicted RNA-binding Zn-ribbon protein involved in translation (DUF1610 family)